MRQLAKIVRVDSIVPIENADSIELAKVLGWQCVVKKGEFKEGDLVVYLEIDSWVPFELAPFLTKGKEPRVYNGVPGEKLRTIRLRGQISQGLILPIASVYGKLLGLNDYYDGQDVTENLGIQKWEKPMNAQLAGVCRSTFPSFIKKTDQERIQNLTRELKDWIEKGYTFEESEKLEGSSMTVFRKDDDFGVCSRNIDLKETEGNAFWIAANKLLLREVLADYGKNIAIQGELIGPGIQGNIYGLKEVSFRVFDIFNIDTFSHFSPTERNKFCFEYALPEVPVMNPGVAGTVFVEGTTVANILQMAEGKSQLADVEREGLVYKCVENPNISFKAISNRYLCNQKD